MRKVTMWWATLACGLAGFLWPSPASAVYPEWAYKRTITLSPATPTNDYQVKIVLTTATFDYGRCDADGDDLRFTDMSDVELGYWIEVWNPSGTSTIWVKVPTQGTTTIKMYYGNPSASPGSNGNNTFDFFDDFSGDLSKWIKRVEKGTITLTSGYVECGGGRTSGDYGHTALGTATYTSFKNGIIEGRVYLSANAIAEVGFRGNFSANTGYKTRMDARSGEGISHLKPPYSGWNFIGSKTGVAVGTGAWKDFRAVVNGSTFTTTCDGRTQTNTDSQYAGPGDISLQNHYGSYARYDDIRVRKYAATEPAATLGIEETNAPGAPVIANVGALSVQADSADLVGELTQGDAPVTVICYWGTRDGGMNPGGWPTNTNLGACSLGLITNHLTGLTPATRYYFRYYATNSAGEDWANSSSVFSTLGAPTVSNDGGATNVGQTAARLRGELIAGNPNPTVWIYWGTTDGGTVKGNWNRPVRYIGQPGLAAFYSDVSGLLANQTYWYRCYASNSYGEAWAAASTNFTTARPTVVINDVTVTEGTSGRTTNAIFTVTLSSTSALDVVVNWQTANGTATTADNDYQAASGALTIPAGAVTGRIVVVVNGDVRYEANETFYVNLTGAVNATIADNQGVGTIANDDWTFYVRGDGLGSDSYDGSTWATAFATLQKALNTIPKPVLPNYALSTPSVVMVQASRAGQSYDVATYSCGYFNPGPTVDVKFLGGWEDVDGTPRQTGWSVVQDMDGTVNEPGLHIDQDTSHSSWKRVVISRFVFTNVTRGVELTQGAGADGAHIWLTLSNVLIHALSDGVYIDYPKPYATLGAGGYAQIKAYNVRIVAGQGGGGACGIYINGGWDGSLITAEGAAPRTGEPNVSTITAPTGTGVYFRAVNFDQPRGSFFNTVIYGCRGPGIHLDAARMGYNNIPASNRVQAVMIHCTIADNGGDGLHMASRTAGSWAGVTNCIFASNAGAGINLEGAGFTCPEGYNVFYGDNLLVNNLPQAIHATSTNLDPLFWAKGTKPDPWYKLGSNFSPAYRSGSDGKNRGAYQADKIPKGSLLMLR
ncbi:MAG: DUF2341 domain-containing protein [Kiritimatiellae bacterium]|nr:DUF2341 domain-containing protein [Kiritimatiellia bacterium]